MSAMRVSSIALAVLIAAAAGSVMLDSVYGKDDKPKPTEQPKPTAGDDDFPSLKGNEDRCENEFDACWKGCAKGIGTATAKSHCEDICIDERDRCAAPPDTRHQQ